MVYMRGSLTYGYGYGGYGYRLSPRSNYIAFETAAATKLQLYKIADDKMEPLGEFSFQGKM